MKKKVNEMLAQQPFYLYLLSVFFVFHGYTENYDFIPLKDIIVLLAIYLGASFLISAAFLLVFKKISKSNLISFLLMGFYFFFGYIYDTLQKISHNSFISRYSFIIISAFSIITIIFILALKSKKPFLRINYFLNSCLVILLLVDLVWLGSKMVNYKSFKDQDFKQQFFACDTCSKPDIYFIVADLYAGDQELKDLMHFDNSDFKNSLRSRGFKTILNSHSNYNYTPFSVASMLEMEYLSHLEGSNTSHNDLSLCYNIIRENKAFEFLFYQGYKLRNLSLFDIYDQPSLLKETILPQKTKFITAQTLFYRLNSNVRFNLAKRFGGKNEKRNKLFFVYKNNEKVYNLTKRMAAEKTNAPRFIYTHLMMPHYPYYFNSAGVAADVDSLEDGKELNPPAYVEYLQYTNKKLLALLDTILSRSAKPPIIILASDHGFREFPYKIEQKYLFMNLLAVYSPQKKIDAFYDGMSTVNLFRILFNAQFEQKFPLLKDTTHFINQ